MSERTKAIKVVVCDICGDEEKHGSHWSENFSAATCDIRQDGYNGAPCEWKNLCRWCRESLIESIHGTIFSLRKQAGFKDEMPEYRLVAYVSPKGWLK